MSYYSAGGYYRAGGFFSWLGNAVKTVANVVKGPVGQLVGSFIPGLGLATQVASAITGGGGSPASIAGAGASTPSAMAPAGTPGMTAAVVQRRGHRGLRLHRVRVRRARRRSF